MTPEHEWPRLARLFARHYCRRGVPSGLTMGDFISAALEGIWRAAQQFDAERGKRWLSFAEWRAHDFMRTLNRSWYARSIPVCVEHPERFVSKEPSPDARMAQEDLVWNAEKRLRWLRSDYPRQAQAIELTTLRGMTYAEAAMVMGVKPTAITALMYVYRHPGSRSRKPRNRRKVSA